MLFSEFLKTCPACSEQCPGVCRNRAAEDCVVVRNISTFHVKKGRKCCNSEVPRKLWKRKSLMLLFDSRELLSLKEMELQNIPCWKEPMKVTESIF